MGNKVVVKVASDLPIADTRWRVDVGDDIGPALAAGNIYYDVLAAATAKIGIEISKYLIDNDDRRLNAEIEKVMAVLKDPATTLG